MLMLKSPRRRRRRVQVQSIVMKGEAGLHEVHLLVTADDLGDAADAIVEAFDGVVARHGANPDFGGQVVFVVYGRWPCGPSLAPELARVQSQLEARIASAAMKTTAGHSFSVRVEQKRSVF